MGTGVGPSSLVTVMYSVVVTVGASKMVEMEVDCWRDSTEGITE